MRGALLALGLALLAQTDRRLLGAAFTVGLLATAILALR